MRAARPHAARDGEDRGPNLPQDVGPLARDRLGVERPAARTFQLELAELS
jgi:hypothetical protein